MFVPFFSLYIHQSRWTFFCEFFLFVVVVGLVLLTFNHANNIIISRSVFLRGFAISSWAWQRSGSENSTAFCFNYFSLFIFFSSTSFIFFQQSSILLKMLLAVLGDVSLIENQINRNLNLFFFVCVCVFVYLGLFCCCYWWVNN